MHTQKKLTEGLFVGANVTGVNVGKGVGLMLLVGSNVGLTDGLLVTFELGHIVSLAHGLYIK